MAHKDLNPLICKRSMQEMAFELNTGGGAVFQPVDDRNPV